MTAPVSKVIAEVIEKRKIVKPAEDAFMEIFNNFAKEIKTFVKENKWYDQRNRYVVISNISWFSITSFYFPDPAEENMVWVTLTADGVPEDYSFTYEELENPAKFASKEYEVYKAERDKTAEAFKEARKRLLLDELEKLN